MIYEEAGYAAGGALFPYLIGLFPEWPAPGPFCLSYHVYISYGNEPL